MKSIKELNISAREIVKQQGEFLLNEISGFENNKAGLLSNINPPETGNSPSIRTKTSFKDIVTYLDIEVENRLKEELLKILPGSEFLAEESDSSLKKGADKLWVIDPIDGTTNFVHQLPFYCISVALQLAGELVLALVYNPALNEFFEAGKGQGARLNQRIIKVSATKDIKQSLLATGFAYNFSQTANNNVKYFEYFQGNSQGIRRLGSAALDICYVAKGIFDGFWELYLNSWDVAAGILLVEEAGGKVTNFQGEPYTFGDKSILAANKTMHGIMLERINNLKNS